MAPWEYTQDFSVIKAVVLSLLRSGVYRRPGSPGEISPLARHFQASLRQTQTNRLFLEKTPLSNLQNLVVLLPFSRCVRPDQSHILH